MNIETVSARPKKYKDLNNRDRFIIANQVNVMDCEYITAIVFTRTTSGESLEPNQQQRFLFDRDMDVFLLQTKPDREREEKLKKETRVQRVFNCVLAIVVSISTIVTISTLMHGYYLLFVLFTALTWQLAKTFFTDSDL